MNALVPVVVAVLGALVYGLSANGKVGELGRLLFAAAVLALMLAFTGRTVHLF